MGSGEDKTGEAALTLAEDKNKGAVDTNHKSWPAATTAPQNKHCFQALHKIVTIEYY